MPASASVPGAVTAKVVSIRTFPEGAAVTVAERILVQFSDGTIEEFPGYEAMENYVFQSQTVDGAKVFLIAWWLARNPGNTRIVIGKTLTFDLSAAAPIKVQ